MRLRRPALALAPRRGRQGIKDFGPDGTALQEGKIDAARKDWLDLTTAERVITLKSLSTGVWLAETRRVRIVNAKVRLCMYGEVPHTPFHSSAVQ